MPHEVDIGVVNIGEMGCITLIGGNIYIIEDTTSMEGDGGPVFPMVDEPLSADMWWENKEKVSKAKALT